jgi:hypothetical protein
MKAEADAGLNQARDIWWHSRLWYVGWLSYMTLVAVHIALHGACQRCRRCHLRGVTLRVSIPLGLRHPPHQIRSANFERWGRDRGIDHVTRITDMT